MLVTGKKNMFLQEIQQILPFSSKVIQIIIYCKKCSGTYILFQNETICQRKIFVTKSIQLVIRQMFNRNNMDNSILAVRNINHIYILVERRLYLSEKNIM